MARSAAAVSRALGVQMRTQARRIKALEVALQAIVNSAEDGTRFHYFVTRASVAAARLLIPKKEKPDG